MKEGKTRNGLLALILFLLLPHAVYSSDKVIGEKRFEKIDLVNPSETLENAKVRLYVDGALMIIHSKGVTSAKSDRLPEKALKELNYYSEERLEHSKLQNMKKEEREAEIARKNEEINRRFKDLDSLSETTKKKLEEGSLKFESGFDIERYLYNEFRKDTEESVYKRWIEERFGKPDYSGKMDWKLLDYSSGRYTTIEYDHWTYFNMLKNRDTDKYTEEISFSFRPDDTFYSYTGPDWGLDSNTYKSLKQSFKIMHKIMIME